MTINKKISYVLFLFLIQLSGTNATEVLGDHLSGKLTSRATFKNFQSYMEYTLTKKLSPTLIAGSGRGKYFPGSKIERYDLVAYENPYDYFLVDLNSESKPDLCLNILDLSPESCGYDYQRIIFENITMYSSFAPKAIRGAFSLLAPGGSLISSGIPMCVYESDIPEIDEIKNNSSIKRFDFVDGKFFHEEDKSGALIPQENMLLDLVFVIDKDISISYLYRKSLDFYNRNKDAFLTFFGLTPNAADIKFEDVLEGSEKWPRRDSYILSEEYNYSKHSLLSTYLMIITKKQ
ncbi:MAG: hypothetical protein LBT70_03405 [Holosporaceae bacterium]|jgi:hypothetical protein|nr:hypothetical protein [Holosporaceae bacterium]